MAELIIKISDIPPGTGKQFEVNGQAIAVFNADGKFFAIDDTCTHAQASLSEGTLEGETVYCPWHGAQFDLQSGKPLCLPAVKGVRTYPTKVEGEILKIEV